MDYEKNIEIHFGAFDSELGEFEYTIPEGYEAKIEDGKVIVRKVDSEDEKIRIEILDYFKNRAEKYPNDPKYKNISTWIAWLEKQCEQNLEWSKEENDKISNIIAWIKDYPRLAKFNEEAFVKANNYAEWIKSIRNKYIPQKQGMCKLSHDDEIMIKQLTEYFTTGKGLQNANETIIEWLTDVKRKLEKQGEQKPEWSEDDEKILKKTIDTIWAYANIPHCGINFEAAKELECWLKSIRPLQKQEWSEEDERIVTELIGIFESAVDGGHVTFPYRLLKDYIRVLKLCLPQSTWKPSEEQIKVCKEVYADILSAKGFDIGTVNGELNRLEEELKKLREE